jgi:hypothetical protein
MDESEIYFPGRKQREFLVTPDIMARKDSHR